MRLLLVGHGHHAQGQDLVDLRGVIQRAFALFGDLRVVVQDDRRDEHQIVFARAAGQNGEATVLTTSRHRVDGRSRRVEQRDELAVDSLGDQMRADERGRDRVVLVIRWRTGIAYLDADARDAAVEMCRQAQLPVELSAGAHQSAAVDGFDVRTAGDADRNRLSRCEIGDGERTERQFAFHRLVPRQPGLTRRRQLVDSLEDAVTGGSFGGAPLQLEEPDHHRERRRVPLQEHLGGQRGVLADAALLGPRGPEHAELPT